jgi:hypothetical protein
MKNTILSDLYQSKELAELINKMHPEHLREDLKQELFLTLCETQDQKIIDLHNRKQLKFYVTRIVLNMIASNTSPFYKKYRRFFSGISEKITNDLEMLDMLSTDNYSSLKPFEKKIMGCNDHLLFDDDNAEQKEYEYQGLVDAVNKVLDKLPHYDREIFKDYVAKGSAGKMIKEMQQLTGSYIPKRSILSTVKKVKQAVRKEVKIG